MRLGSLLVPTLGTNESLRIALGLRLGVPVDVEHTSVVGQMLMFLEHMVCLVGVVAAISHGMLLLMNRFVVLWCPVSMCRNYGKRPDEMTLIPCRRGLPLVWDFTCSDTLAPSNFSTSFSGASRLANSGEATKIRRYSTLTTNYAA